MKGFAPLPTNGKVPHGRCPRPVCSTERLACSNRANSYPNIVTAKAKGPGRRGGKRKQERLPSPAHADIPLSHEGYYTPAALGRLRRPRPRREER